MMQNTPKQHVIIIIVLIICSGGIAGALGVLSSRERALIKTFDLERDSVRLPVFITLTGSGFERSSNSGLPRYAPHAVYYYYYDRSLATSAFDATVASLTSAHFAITSHDISTPNRHVGSDWYIRGVDAIKGITLLYIANGNSIRLVAARNNDKEADFANLTAR